MDKIVISVKDESKRDRNSKNYGLPSEVKVLHDENSLEYFWHSQLESYPDFPTQHFWEEATAATVSNNHLYIGLNT